MTSPLARLLTSALVGACLLALAPAAAGQSDHPLISRYLGSTLTKQDAKHFDRYRLTEDGRQINRRVELVAR